jgi:hypothetical protein
LEVFALMDFFAASIPPLSLGEENELIIEAEIAI